MLALGKAREGGIQGAVIARQGNRAARARIHHPPIRVLVMFAVHKPQKYCRKIFFAM